VLTGTLRGMEKRVEVNAKTNGGETVLRMKERKVRQEIVDPLKSHRAKE